jgi:hypothetical protein
MQNSNSNPVLTACQSAIADDNVELCIEIMLENYPGDKTILSLSGQAKALWKERINGIIAYDAYSTTRSKIRNSLLELITDLERLEKTRKTTPAENSGKEAPTAAENKVKEIEENPFLVGVHERILVVKCKGTPTDWERIFPETRYSHVGFMEYKKEIPEGFSNPDVIIFDDLNCPGLLGNENEIIRLAEAMPLAYLLYVGDTGKNPIKDRKDRASQAIFGRMNNANSRLTVPARLNELLEFRKNFGPPLTTMILENMKDKLPLKVFISYSHRDEDWKNELDIHLATMKRQGLINVWQDRRIKPGAEWDETIKAQLEQSHLILFLVSPGFMASDYIQDYEVPLAISLHREGLARVVPIFIKHVEWKGAVFGKLQGLPRDEKFLDTQENKDRGLATVAKELRELIGDWYN